jgi:hypothetical protein
VRAEGGISRGRQKKKNKTHSLSREHTGRDESRSKRKAIGQARGTHVLKV